MKSIFLIFATIILAQGATIQVTLTNKFAFNKIIIKSFLKLTGDKKIPNTNFSRKLANSFW